MLIAHDNFHKTFPASRGSILMRKSHFLFPSVKVNEFFVKITSTMFLLSVNFPHGGILHRNIFIRKIIRTERKCFLIHFRDIVFSRVVN